MRKKILIWICLVVPIIPWIIGSGSYIFPLHSEYSDLVISHLPNAEFLEQFIASQGVVPVWSGLIYSGFPFLANPLSGAWYPPAWIVLLFDGPQGFNLLFLVHLIWAGWGMYKFLQNLGLGEFGSLIGAMVFEFMPKLFAHEAAGHVSLIWAISWTPWLLFVESRQFPRIRLKNILAGTIFGLIILADIRWSAYVAILWFLFWIIEVVIPRYSRSSSGSVISVVTNKLGQIFFGFGISAPFIILFQQYVGLSTRAALETSDVLEYSLPWDKLLGFLIPDFAGYAEWILYPGGLAICAFVYALAKKEVRRKAWFWILVFFGCLVYSLGDNLPLFTWTAKLPVLNLLRVPSRFMFMGGFCLAVITAIVFDYLKSNPLLPSFDPVFFMVGIAGFVVLLTLGLVLIGAPPPSNFLWAILSLVSSLLLISAFQRSWLPTKVAVGLCLVTVILDLGGVNWFSQNWMPVDSFAGKDQKLVDFFESDQDIFRIYSPTFSVSQIAAAEAGLEFANGIDPMQIEKYFGYFRLATGVDNQGKYSVTLPMITTDDLRIANMDARPNLDLLGKLNVKYIVSDYEYTLDGLVEVASMDGVQVYRNTFYRPRAWLQESTAEPADYVEVKIDSYAPGNILITTNLAGVLVFSEVAYPGWRVYVDGVQQKVLEVHGVFPAVELQAGQHQVLLQFSPIGLVPGVIIGLLCWILAIRISVIELRNKYARKI